MYHNTHQAKILMALFGNLKYKIYIFFNVHDNIMEKIHYGSNLILIQWLDEKDWIKSMHMYNI